MELQLQFSSVVRDLPVYIPGRPIEEVAREYGLDPKEIIKLASNENPLGPSPLAVKAVRAYLRKIHLYPDGNVFYLKNALAHKLGVKPENIVFGNGSNEILELVGHVFLERNTEVVVSRYCFAVYPIVARLFGAKLIEVPDLNYGHDLPGMLAAITPATRVVFVANPNNPTGTRVPNESLVKFVMSVPDHVLVVVDEAYFEYLEDPPDLISIIREGRRTNLLLVRTFSKIYGLAGLRIGYGIGNARVIAMLEKVREPFNVNAIAQVAALAALDDTKHVTRTRRLNNRSLRFFEKEIKRLGLEYVPSAANFVLVKVGAGARVCQEMQRRGVIVRPMDSYGLPEWIRISTGTMAENRRCIETLSEVLGLQNEGMLRFIRQ
jgi:histidinol-phosphate aminotransferase